MAKKIQIREIGGLIVREQDSRKGIASLLVRHFEKHAGECVTIRVRCNVKRELAHKFYLNLDYKEKKVQKIFEKSIYTK